MDKFSELKAVAATYSVALNAHRENPTDKGALYAWDEATTAFSRAISNREMEIIIALLAELEASKTNAEYYKSAFEEQRDHADMLEKQLATPVRLAQKNTGWDRDDGEDCWNNAIDACAKELRAAGFKCVGDE